MLNFVPKVTRQDVERVVRREFPAEIIDRVLDILDQYGQKKWHLDKDRVQLACLILANGELDALQRQISVATNVDYRDVLAAAEFPGQFKIGFVGMEKLHKSNPSDLEDQREDWRQYEAWLNGQADG